MKVSELADLLVGIGTCLTGIATLIKVIKKEPKERRKARKFK